MPFILNTFPFSKPGVSGSHQHVLENHINGSPHPQGLEPVFGSGSGAAGGGHVIGGPVDGDGSTASKGSAGELLGNDSDNDEPGAPGGTGGRPGPCPI